MRIALLNWTRRLAGGAEVTLSGSGDALAREGHELGLWYEIDRPLDRPILPCLDGQPSFCVEELGAKNALAALSAWKPDVLLVHGVVGQRLERAALQTAPGVLFAHGYHGTCISGTKTFTFPQIRPCSRRFGWGCLLRYYPRRVGGLNPVTMAREYRRQADRLGTLQRYDLLLVLSEHMRSEYMRHGLSPERVVHLPYPPIPAVLDALARVHARSRLPGDPLRLLFVGRMDSLKGGAALLAALPRVAQSLGAPLELSFAGDGPVRRLWEARAAAMASHYVGITVRFRGWLMDQGLQVLYRDSDLIVMPSLWPEPFGRVGLEAGAYGLPCTAFAVGGIPEWLTEGVNGTLAPGNPPTVTGLSDAITRALEDPVRYSALRRGALAIAGRATAAPFARALVGALELAASRAGAT